MSVDAVETAYESLVLGDIEPLVSFMSDDMLWEGIKKPWRFWHPVPS